MIMRTDRLAQDLGKRDEQKSMQTLQLAWRDKILFQCVCTSLNEQRINPFSTNVSV